IFVMGASVDSQTLVDCITGAKKVIESFATSPPTQAEIDRAKNDVIGEISNIVSRPDALPDPWLDSDTYRLRSVQKPIEELRAVAAPDLQRVANRLFKDATLATVVVGDPLQLKP